ncbi:MULTISPECIES: LysR family transcriptional regulator [Pseudomonas]|uniref:LysR family transcriptional regulator n=1 Tax=Pseudomonas TaxID=286 RepID=UPI00119CF3C0|nr:MULTISPECIES: LysR family transcriptional regulator [Pseudomonas]MBI6923866.1 LysR family transcriptional regulator [Pseudomonas putida]
MHKKLLPSMMSLQCFESTARHASFTLAARELNLTQSAVSKQVAQLEQMLQRRLFNRLRGGLQLTAVGELYLSEVGKILSQTDISTRFILTFDGQAETLRIATQPTFGSRWLIPRLPVFSAAFPHVRLSVRNELEPFDLLQAKADVAFFYGRGTWPGAQCVELFREDVVPVCAPALLLHRPLKAIDDIHSHTLLQCVSRPEAWHDWLGAQAMTSRNSYRGPQFDTFDLCIRAAIAGLGVALVPRFMVTEELQRGALLIPLHYYAPSPDAHYVAYATQSHDSPKIRNFVDWVCEQTP